MSKIQTKTVLTLSKYEYGEHHFDESRRGEISFWESLNPVCALIKDIHQKGARLGDKIEVQLKLVKRAEGV